MKLVSRLQNFRTPTHELRQKNYELMMKDKQLDSPTSHVEYATKSSTKRIRIQREFKNIQQVSSATVRLVVVYDSSGSARAASSQNSNPIPNSFLVLLKAKPSFSPRSAA